MCINRRNHFKRFIYLFVLIGFSTAHGGSYEDFFSAIKRDDERGVSALLARGFDPNTLDPEGLHGLFLAMREPSEKVSGVLLSTPKVDVNVLNPKGESPLMIAAITGQNAFAEKLVHLGADINKTGWAPLHYAATRGNIALMTLFLENHAYIDAESPNGTTPLMMAAMYGSADAVRLLLVEGAVPQLKNQQGLTAIDFARRANRADAADLIAAAIRKQAGPGRW